MYVMLGVDDNVLVPIHCDDFGVAVGVTAVVDEACKSALSTQPHTQQDVCQA